MVNLRRRFSRASKGRIREDWPSYFSSEDPILRQDSHSLSALFHETFQSFGEAPSLYIISHHIAATFCELPSAFAIFAAFASASAPPEASSSQLGTS